MAEFIKNTTDVDDDSRGNIEREREREREECRKGGCRWQKSTS